MISCWARVPALLKQIETPLASTLADSAYDKEAVNKAIEAHNPGLRTRVLIPPQWSHLRIYDSDGAYLSPQLQPSAPAKISSPPSRKNPAPSGSVSRAGAEAGPAAGDGAGGGGEVATGCVLSRALLN